MSKPLTAQQSRFVDEYLKDLNATQAYMRAGYKAKGNAAESAAVRLLRNVKVQQTIQERMNDRAQRTQIDADFVLHGIAKNIKRCEQATPMVRMPVRLASSRIIRRGFGIATSPGGLLSRK